MNDNTNPKFESRIIEPETVAEYLNVTAAIRTLEKRKSELREAIIESLPNGAEALGPYAIYVEEASRRTFPLDFVKAKVSGNAWLTYYEPFIKTSFYFKLVIKERVDS